MTIYDDESNIDKVVTYYERAITVDNVDLVSGGYPPASNVAIMPLVEKYGKVFISSGGMMKSFEQGFTYSFASPPLLGEWAYISVAVNTLDVDMKTELIQALIPIGLWHVKEVLEQQVKQMAGERYKRLKVRSAG